MRGLLSTPCNGFLTRDISVLGVRLHLSTPCNGFLDMLKALYARAVNELLSTPCNGFSHPKAVPNHREPSSLSTPCNGFLSAILVASPMSPFSLSTPCNGFGTSLHLRGIRPFPFNSM